MLRSAVSFIALMHCFVAAFCGCGCGSWRSQALLGTLPWCLLDGNWLCFASLAGLAVSAVPLRVSGLPCFLFKASVCSSEASFCACPAAKGSLSMIMHALRQDVDS